jgi:uncharacterized protein with von Willebrand factor type A (vWA) domain
MEHNQFQLDVHEILETLLENDTIKELCIYNPEILEQITQKVIDFIAVQIDEKASKEGQKTFSEDIIRQAEQMQEMRKTLARPIRELQRMFGLSEGNWRRVNFSVVNKYARLLERNKEIQQFADMLGRMSQLSKKYEAGKSELTGIHESADISNILPSETVILASKTSAILFYKKFLEKKLQTFEFAERKLEELRGPIIICVDTSGSMEGDPENAAKMLCLAFLKQASKGNRKCYLISFSTSIKTINLTRIKTSLNKIIDFLTMSFHGGTDAMEAMQEALKMLETNHYKKADVVMVSDFEMGDLNKNMKEKMKQAQENKTKFHSIVIGHGANRTLMKNFDHVWRYNPDDRENMFTLIKNIGSL